ncbi:uncharacterized protein EMH_0090840 [Eimeria mitis]|uniref:Uncharacterized protein n=1 Tax=Eimeria mitis TaxID=44415 RepID=U6K932_9EIME|nr:uncharacterized protein EMH_0090840 [Eimeria mitis]CDJ34535.1 hypothetical protein, conserved [Eimeria mitis]
MGCIVSTAQGGVRDVAEEDLDEDLVIALPHGLGCLYTRTRRRRDEGLPLDLLALSVLLATGVLCGLGSVSELSLLGRLLVRLQEWAAALRFLTETLPQLRSGNNGGAPAASEPLPSVSIGALQLLLTEARPCPRIRVPCSLAAERLLLKGQQLQQQMIVALVQAERDAAEQLKQHEALHQARKHREQILLLQPQQQLHLGDAVGQDHRFREELQQAEAGVAAAEAAHAAAEAAVARSNQQLLDLEQQLHSSGIGGLQYEPLFHELVAACAWQREAEALAACIEMESDASRQQQQQAGLVSNQKPLPPAYRNTAHLWRMVQVYEPLQRVLEFEKRVRELQVVGPLPQLVLAEGGSASAPVVLPATKGPAALLEQNSQQQQPQQQRLSWAEWLSLVEAASNLGLDVESATLVKQLHARAVMLQQKVQSAVTAQPIPSLEAARVMLMEASNLPVETAGIGAVSAAIAAVDAWEQKAEAALQQLQQQLQLQQLQQRCGLPPQQLLQLQQNQAPRTDALWALIDEASKLPIAPEGIPAYVRLKKVSSILGLRV